MIFYSESSSLVLPGYQSCLRLVEGEKYRTLDQREEMSKIQCKVSIRVMRASPTLYEMADLKSFISLLPSSANTAGR